MECVPIKIHKKDDFPINICSNCLEKVRISWDFRLCAIQSDIKLHNFYEARNAETQKKSQYNDDDPDALNKEDRSAVQLEIEGDKATKNIVPADSLECSNDVLDLRNTGIENEEFLVNESFKDKSEMSLSTDESSNDSTNESNLYSDNSASESSENSSEEPLKKDKKCLRGVLNKKKTLLASKKRKYTKITIAKSRQLRLGKQKAQLNGENASLQRKRTYTKKSNTSSDVNRQQAALLDNPDYKRIMEMPLTVREKNLQLVYCPDCKKSYSFQYFVSIHSHFHTGNLPFKCEKCDRRFPKASTLKQHLRQHVDTRNYTCDLCGRAFFHPQNLKSHKLQVHSNERPHKCDICGKGFKIIFLLQKHIKIHKNERDHVCEVCGKAFVGVGALSSHQQSHVSDKNFSCKLCDKKFRHKRTLQLHERRHTGEKPYSCDQCGRSFSSNELVKQHMLIHTGEKPFACEICGQRFRQKACIPRHMRIHTGETPYPCKLCPSKFKYSHHLLKHMKNNHEKEQVPI
ncbi:hypothetical protein Trydic_g19601 [Trypoxylus dichotomus]